MSGFVVFEAVLKMMVWAYEDGQRATPCSVCLRVVEWPEVDTQQIDLIHHGLTT